MTRQLEQKYEEQARRRRERMQLVLIMLDEWMNGEDAQGMRLNSIVIRHGRDRGLEPLVIVKGSFEGKLYVGFSSGADAETALLGALERVRDASMKWREDKPFPGPKE